MKYLFSACLLGIKCRYDGATSENQEILERWKEEGGLVVCPEQLGGLPTPRKPSTLKGGDGHDVLDGNARLTDEDGTDVTDNFLRGAKETARLAGLASVQRAYMKSGSPSCGFLKTNISWKRTKGCGVTAALLARQGIKIIEVE